MATRNTDTNTRRDTGTSGNGHGYSHERTEGETERTRGEREGAGPMRTTAGTSDEPRAYDSGGRFYERARGREREGRRWEDDRLLGMGYAASGRGRGDWTGGRGESDYRGDMGRDYRGDYRRDVRAMGGRVIEPDERPERGYRASERGIDEVGWTGGFTEMGSEYEHGRHGFRDFGTPSRSQGREVRSHYSDRDFPGRDDRVAGRSGQSFHPEETGPTHAWRPPEEDWERAHWRQVHRDERPRFFRTRGRHHEGQWEHESTTAEDVMTQNPKSVRVDATLRDVAQIMRDENCGVVPVVGNDRRLLGVITDRDMVLRTADNDRAWTQLNARDVMTDEVEAVTPEEPVREIIHLMAKKQVRRVPVVDRQDRLLGLISMVDIANRAEKDEELQDAMVQVSRRKSFWRKLWT